MATAADSVPTEEIAKGNTVEQPTEPIAKGHVEQREATPPTGNDLAAAESAPTASAVIDTPAPAPIAGLPEPEHLVATEPAAPPREREMVADSRLGVLRAMFPDFDDSLLFVDPLFARLVLGLFYSSAGNLCSIPLMGIRTAQSTRSWG